MDKLMISDKLLIEL